MHRQQAQKTNDIPTTSPYTTDKDKKNNRQKNGPAKRPMPPGIRLALVLPAARFPSTPALLHYLPRTCGIPRKTPLRIWYRSRLAGRTDAPFNPRLSGREHEGDEVLLEIVEINSLSAEGVNK